MFYKKQKYIDSLGKEFEPEEIKTGITTVFPKGHKKAATIDSFFKWGSYIRKELIKFKMKKNARKSN